jgi:hypothetical protein
MTGSQSLPRMDNSLVTRPIVSCQNVIDVKNIIVILVIRAIVMTRLTRLRQDPPRVMSRFVPESRVTDAVRLSQLCRQTFQRLRKRD